MIKSFWKNLLWRAWEIIGSVNVRVKIMGIVIGGTLLLSVALAIQIRASVTRLMEQQLENQGISIARDLAARATDDILVNDLYALRQLLLETQNNNPDVIYAFVLDPQGKVLVHTFGEGFPAGLAQMNSVSANQHHSTILLDTPQGLVWDVAVPIFDGRAGTARIGLSGAIINQVVLSITSQMLITMVFVLALSLLAAAFLTFVLTRPILELVAATRIIAKGDFTPRELHDSTSQSLTSLMVGLKTLDTLCDHPQVHSHARDLRNVTGQVLQDVHEIAFQLRPAALDDLGLPAAIERLTQDWQKRYQIRTDVTVHLGDERLPDNVETALYRIVQEALTNVARHAGAGFVSVLVERRTQEVVAVIEDDGKGMDPTHLPAGRLGVAGMRERAELIGGKLTIESTANAGTSLFIQIPIPQPEGAYS
jgi:sensor histidine kinase regulating citrate/malate metabolism